MAEGNSADLLRVIGPDAFMAFVQQRGGTVLWVPKSADNAKIIDQIIGREACQKLVEEFGGFEVKIPNLKQVPASDHRVMPLLNQGMSDTQIAIIVGVTTETVRKVRKRNPPSLVGVKQSEGKLCA